MSDWEQLAAKLSDSGLYADAARAWVRECMGAAWDEGADAQWEQTDEPLTNDSARNPYRKPEGA